MEDDDVYVAQLREVFDSCDVNGNGWLRKHELIELCQKLQLEDQIPLLIAQLLGNNDHGEVSICVYSAYMLIHTKTIHDWSYNFNEWKILQLKPLAIEVFWWPIHLLMLSNSFYWLCKREFLKNNPINLVFYKHTLTKDITLLHSNTY